MSHRCFISFKKEDTKYKDIILKKLGEERVQGKALDREIESEDIDYIMQEIRENYMKGTTVTVFLIANHSSENEGLDEMGRNKQAFIIRELQATLYDRKNNPRDGLLGVVLPEMYDKVYSPSIKCDKCGKDIGVVAINDSTVIREFHENYWLEKNECGHYSESGRYAVLCKYDDFINDPDTYITKAYEKTKEKIADKVHFRDIKHKGMHR